MPARSKAIATGRTTCSRRRTGGKGSFSYLDAPTAREARERVARYRAFRAGLKGLQRVNGSLVELLRRYQQAQLRKTVRRLGLPAAKNP